VKRYLVSTICAVSLCVMMLPGTAAGTARAAQPAAMKQLTILLSVPALKFPFFVYMEHFFQQSAVTLGAEMHVKINVIVADAQQSATKQTTDIEAAIAQKVDGVVISPLTKDSLVPAIKEVAKAGIPLVTIDRETAAGATLAHVGADNVLGGVAEGNFVAKALHGKGNVILLEGTPGASPAIDRTKGIKAALSTYHNIHIVFDQTANFDRATAITVIEAATGSVKHFDAVICENDDMALGAITALEGKGMLHKVVVTGYDAINDALSAIKAGKLAATIEQYPNRQDDVDLRILLNYILHKVKPKQHDTFLTPIAISKANLRMAVVKK